jgi:hypothetical protein
LRLNCRASKKSEQTALRAGDTATINFARGRHGRDRDITARRRSRSPARSVGDTELHNPPLPSRNLQRVPAGRRHGCENKRFRAPHQRERHADAPSNF